ncbi:MAG: leucine-rich repeat domain-containing protein [Oscillospiraceae bacterium]|nr:leucine-rich repeat domain-containing protein [Oscillospiraceae bacterium]
MSISYFQEFKITEIIPRLWVSNRLIAERDYSIIKEKGIDAIVSLVEEHCEPLPDIDTLHCPVTDGKHIPAFLLDKIFSFVRNALQNTNVLIYCSAGISRSAGIAMGIIMAQENCSWEQAHEVFNQNRFSWVCTEVRESVQRYFLNQCQSPEERRLLCSEDAKALQLLEKEIGFTLPPAKEAGWSSRGYKIKGNHIIGLGLCNMGLQVIPADCRFPRLEFLHLSGNRIEHIPELFFEMPVLKELHLNNNRISRLPETLNRMKSLKEFNCRNNLIIDIPHSIREIRENLMYMNFEANRLEKLPEEIGALSNLRALNLRDNQLYAIPESMGDLDSLISLALVNNHLSRLPGSITKLNKLKRLNIGLNKRLKLLKEQENWLHELKANDCLIIRDL